MQGKPLLAQDRSEYIRVRLGHTVEFQFAEEEVIIHDDPIMNHRDLSIPHGVVVLVEGGGALGCCASVAYHAKTVLSKVRLHKLLVLLVEYESIRGLIVLVDLDAPVGLLNCNPRCLRPSTLVPQQQGGDLIESDRRVAKATNATDSTNMANPPFCSPLVFSQDSPHPLGYRGDKFDIYYTRPRTYETQKSRVVRTLRRAPIPFCSCQRAYFM